MPSTYWERQYTMSGKIKINLFFQCHLSRQFHDFVDHLAHVWRWVKEIIQFEFIDRPCTSTSIAFILPWIGCSPEYVYVPGETFWTVIHEYSHLDSNQGLRVQSPESLSARTWEYFAVCPRCSGRRGPVTSQGV